MKLRPKTPADRGPAPLNPPLRASAGRRLSSADTSELSSSRRLRFLSVYFNLVVLQSSSFTMTESQNATLFITGTSGTISGGDWPGIGVQPGQVARISLAAYDPSRYGVVMGVVRVVGRTRRIG